MAHLRAPLLAAFLLVALMLQVSEAGPYGANVEDSVCCRDYIRRPVNHRLVKNFFWTSNSCRRPGVVLLTTRNMEICADPSKPWVERILQRLER